MAASRELDLPGMQLPDGVTHGEFLDAVKARLERERKEKQRARNGNAVGAIYEEDEGSQGGAPPFQSDDTNFPPLPANANQAGNRGAVNNGGGGALPFQANTYWPLHQSPNANFGGTGVREPAYASPQDGNMDWDYTDSIPPTSAPQQAASARQGVAPTGTNAAAAAVAATEAAAEARAAANVVRGRGQQNAPVGHPQPAAQRPPAAQPAVAPAGQRFPPQNFTGLQNIPAPQHAGHRLQPAPQQRQFPPMPNLAAAGAAAVAAAGAAAAAANQNARHAVAAAVQPHHPAPKPVAPPPEIKSAVSVQPPSKFVEPPEEDEPRQFVCPISDCLFIDPVMTTDGHTYEREQIMKWFENHNTSPVTNLPLVQGTAVFPNWALKSAIEVWKKEHGRA